MTALNIRDFGAERKVALDAEANSLGLSSAELVRKLVDEGLDRLRSKREQEAWIRDSEAGIAASHARLAEFGPSLARYRNRLNGRDS